MQLAEYGYHFMLDKIRKSAAQREVRRVAGPLSGSSWQINYLYTMLGTTIKLSILFQVSVGYLSLERRLFLDFCLAVTEISTKKV